MRQSSDQSVRNSQLCAAAEPDGLELQCKNGAYVQPVNMVHISASQKGMRACRVPTHAAMERARAAREGMERSQCVPSDRHETAMRACNMRQAGRQAAMECPGVRACAL